MLSGISLWAVLWLAVQILLMLRDILTSLARWIRIITSTARLRQSFVTVQTDTAAVTERLAPRAVAQLAIFAPVFCARIAAASVWAVTLSPAAEAR